MSILIKNMKMPPTGLYFASVDNTSGKDKTVVTIGRMLDNRDVRQVVGSFELIPVPPHGDLIERKAAYNSILNGMVMTGYQSKTLDCINEFYVPTVIPASEEGE